jgi:hypothetical protein
MAGIWHVKDFPDYAQAGGCAIEMVLKTKSRDEATREKIRILSVA